MHMRIALAAFTLAGLVAAAPVQAQGTGVTTIATFTPPTLPESISLDAAGNIFTVGAGNGQVIRIAPDGSRTTLATVNAGGGFTLGVAAETGGSVLVANASQNAQGADANGVWRVRSDGTKQLAAAIPAGGLTNDILPIPGGGFYVSDSGIGVIYRVTPAGTVEKWAEHDLIKPNPDACSPAFPLPVGGNGMAFAPDGSVLISNTSKATIVRVPVNPNASAGTPTVWAGPDCRNLQGADGIAADGRGGVYVAVNIQNKVVNVASSGAIRTLATAADGLDFPSSVKLGTGRYAGSVIVGNAALSAAAPPLVSFRPGPEPRPSIVAIGPSRVAGVGFGLPATGDPVSRPMWGWAAALAAGLLVGAGAAVQRKLRAAA